MPDFGQLGRDFQCTGTEFLLTELDVALTFIQVAATTRDTETARRNRGHACEAYATVLDFMRKLDLPGADRQAIEAKLGEIRGLLRAAGCEI